MAFRIHEDNVPSVRSNLFERETGYHLVRTSFHRLDNKTGEERCIEMEVFVANEKVETYLGPASEEEIAWQIYHSQVVGKSFETC